MERFEPDPSHESPPRTRMTTGSAYIDALLERTPVASVNRLLMRACIALYLLMVVFGVDWFNPKAPELLRWGANFGPNSTGGEPWRLISCVFIHVGIIHLVFNMYVQNDLGRVVESFYGHAGFAVLYLASGIGGSLASIAWRPNGVSAGASGAIFGVCGGLFAFLSVARMLLPHELWRRQRSSIVMFLVINTVFALQFPAIDMAAHFGGFATGYVVGIALGFSPTKGVALPASTIRSIIVALGSVAAAAGALEFISLHHQGRFAAKWSAEREKREHAFRSFAPSMTRLESSYFAIDSDLVGFFNNNFARMRQEARTKVIWGLEERVKALAKEVAEFETHDADFRAVVDEFSIACTRLLEALASLHSYNEDRLEKDIRAFEASKRAADAAMTEVGRKFGLLAAELAE